ncbi:regulator of sigma E protease [Rhizobium anhuiense]
MRWATISSGAGAAFASLPISVGFGPEIFGFTDRHGTRWKISVIPLGGYVRFFGDEDASSKPDADKLAAMSEEDRARSFAGAKLWKRAATVAAGPIANFLLAIAIFTVLFSVYGRMIADPVVAEVKPDGAAAAAGILPGDLLVAIDGNKVETFDDVRRYVSIRPSQKIVVTIERGGEKLDLPMVPQRTDQTDQFGNKIELGQIGIVTNQQAGNFRLKTYTPLEALQEGVIQTRDIVTGTFKYIGNIFAGTMRADQLGGPIRVAQASGQMATLGIGAVLQLAAMLSVSIGLLNLMPVPVLDGGHLMFYAVEAVRGKPLGSTAQEIAFRIGLAMILTLMVFTTWNDIGSIRG